MNRILIANRGEIAVRVMRSAHEMGYETVAVYSEPDAHAPHVKMATCAVALGGSSAAESYLDVAKILAACEHSGADAVHPGYGFLSERASFAEALSDAGLTFIGPPAAAIAAMGSKSESKRLMEAAGVPCVPGYHGEEQSDERLIVEAERIGYPVMVKASSGGGGKGMRLVQRAEELGDGLRAARSEAMNAFGDDRLLLEKAIVNPRHIEIQVFADTHGHVVHLGERDCSVQRRHQKVIEEAPGVGVSEALRTRMGDAAVAAARSIDYVGAGTVEFLLLPDGETFYFLEMNTRLQVEHPITEMVTGCDLVRWQLLVAEGDRLPCTQDEIAWRGHAIEVRLYAEDPFDGFLPQSGTLRAWRPASGEHVRVDSGVSTGHVVSPFYDPMLAKFIVWGETREEARRGLVRALEQSVVLGTRTNASFLRACLEHEAFVRGEYSTAFIQDAFGELKPKALTSIQWLIAGAVYAMHEAKKHKALWGAHQGWSSTGALRSVMHLKSGGEDRVLDVDWGVDGVGEVNVWDDLGQELHAKMSVYEDEQGWHVKLGTLTRTVMAAQGASGELWLSQAGEVWCVVDLYGKAVRKEEKSDGMVRAPMTGKLLSVRVKPGDRVTQGAIVMVLEAMKMEHELVAPSDGVVSEVYVQQGDQVTDHAVLMVMEDA